MSRLARPLVLGLLLASCSSDSAPVDSSTPRELGQIDAGAQPEAAVLPDSAADLAHLNPLGDGPSREGLAADQSQTMPDLGNVTSVCPLALGDTGNDTGYAIALDKMRNVYLAGRFEGTVTVGGTKLVSKGSRDILVVKLDAGCNLQWAISAGGSVADEARAIAVDAAGNSYVTGSFQGAATFGSISKTSAGASATDLFVAKIDAAGSFVWVTTAGGTLGEHGYGIAVDGSGQSYVTGSFQTGPVAFGTTTLSGKNWELFVAKLDASGKFAWATSGGGSSNDYGRAIAVDAVGRTTVVGDFVGQAVFGKASFSAKGWSDVVVAQIDATGSFVWAASTGSANDVYGAAVALDGAGNAYAAGMYQGSLQLGASSVSSEGFDDVFVAKLDSSGKFEWVSSAGGTSFDSVGGLGVDSARNIYLSGTIEEGDATFDQITVSGAGSTDIFVAKLSSAGDFLWAKTAGGTEADEANALAVDQAGNSYITGDFGGKASLGAATLTSKGQHDAFVARVDPAGKL